MIRQRLHHHKPTNAANEANPAIPPQSTDRVALSALVFAGVHWTLWKTCASEMNPLVSCVIAVQREWQLGAYNEAALEFLLEWLEDYQRLEDRIKARNRELVA